MDALYPRLLVNDFAAAVDFYSNVLRDLFAVEPVKVIPPASYANWDLEGQAGLVLFGRAAMAATVGTENLPASQGQDTAMLVLKVDDVDAAVGVLEKYGATSITAPQNRPEWGPTLRAAHLRDVEGNLLELQSY